MRTTLVDLPVPPVALPVWGPSVQSAWNDRASRTSTLTARAGVGRNFDALLQEARYLLAPPNDESAVLARAGDRRFVRALFAAWGDEALARRTMTPTLVGGLASIAAFSRLGTIGAASLLLEHFDLLDAWSPGLFDALAQLVRAAVARQPARSRGDLVESLRGNEAVVFVPDGPHRLAEWLVARGTEPTSWLRVHSLSGYADSRFGRTTRDAYFLAWIAAADAQIADDTYLAVISKEVVTRQRTETTGVDGRYFGHQVLEALATKDTRHPSAAWLEAVLAIGGDPRMQGTDQWRTWWARVSPTAVQRATQWMQGVNLRAFLDGVDAYARANGNEGMQRMLERRRTFLSGLYEQDRVEDVRLILGPDIQRWIAQNLPAVVSSDVAHLVGAISSDTAIVYVNCGGFSLVEGSHNFKLHLYVGGPVPQIADRRQTSFDVADLRDTYPWVHGQTHGRTSYLPVAHLGGDWIRKALDFLRSRGVQLDERALMTRDDYADLARRRARW